MLLTNFHSLKLKVNQLDMFHGSANEFKTVGLLSVDHRVEQLQLGHMFNIINVKATEYLRTNVETLDTPQAPATWHMLFVKGSG